MLCFGLFKRLRFFEEEEIRREVIEFMGTKRGEVKRGYIYIYIRAFIFMFVYVNIYI